MVRLTLARLVNACIRILARPPEISDMAQQMSVGILHSQVAEVHADREERNRRLPSGPTLDR